MSNNTVTIAKDTFDYLVDLASDNSKTRSLLRSKAVTDLLLLSDSCYPSIDKDNLDVIMGRCSDEA